MKKIRVRVVHSKIGDSAPSIPQRKNVPLMDPIRDINSYQLIFHFFLQFSLRTDKVFVS
jgi:hypothetical protein